MTATSFDAESRANRLRVMSLVLTLTAVLGIAVWLAWVCDDAYITFRVVDNFVTGFGLRWNTDERVQVFTHPLWMLIHIPPYALSKNIYITTIVVSVGCTVAALWFAMQGLPRTHWVLPLLFAGLLLSSRAFRDYTSSGLETPLSYLLFAVFVSQLRGSEVRWGRLLTLASLAALNRLDSLVLYLPVLIYLMIKQPTRPRARDLLGVLPLVSWSIFALFYYGFVFPNTKPAKLSTGVGPIPHIEQGLRYLLDLACNDPPSFALMATGILLGLLVPWKGEAKAALMDRNRHACVALGVLGYAAYVIYVGGDFMRGRFFAVPVFAATWVGLSVVHSFSRREQVLCALVVVLSLPMALLPTKMFASFIDDQRGLYAGRYSLISRRSDGSHFVRTDLKDHGYLREHDGFLGTQSCRPALVVRGAVGIFGFYAGPDVIVIDQYALSDALLARLPWKPVPLRTFAIKGLPVGHFTRGFPEGYVQSRAAADLGLIDPALRAYYDRLHLVTSGDLFSGPRWKAIAELNLGIADDRLDTYVATRYGATRVVGLRAWCAADLASTDQLGAAG